MDVLERFTNTGGRQGGRQHQPVSRRWSTTGQQRPSNYAAWDQRQRRPLDTATRGPNTHAGPGNSGIGYRSATGLAESTTVVNNRTVRINQDARTMEVLLVETSEWKPAARVVNGAASLIKITTRLHRRQIRKKKNMKVRITNVG